MIIGNIAQVEDKKNESDKEDIELSSYAQQSLKEMVERSQDKRLKKRAKLYKCLKKNHLAL